jgi:pimeloyl-ACP methyl ester carboxylesterase
MDRVDIEKVILAGHSLAGLELSRFSALYPDRILKLIFLDAAFDYTSSGYKDMLEKNPLLKIQPPGANDDHSSVEDYIASTKRAYPALAAIWSELLDEHVIHEVEIALDGKVIDRMTDAITKALRAGIVNSYTPEHSKMEAPVLSIFAISNGCYYISDDWMTETQKTEVNEFFNTTHASWLRGNIEQFRQNVPHAKILEIPQGHHYCFIKKEELVFSEMRKFLVE